MSEESERLNRITEDIIGAAIEVHREIGPGLLESAYEACLAFELGERKRKVARQVPLPLVYKNVKLDCGYRLDLLVDDLVIVELKAVDELNDVHKAQLLVSQDFRVERWTADQFQRQDVETRCCPRCE